MPGVRNSEGPILDRIEVFNSVEVLAPEIDDMNKNNQIDISGKFNRVWIFAFVNTSNSIHSQLVLNKFLYYLYIKFLDAQISFFFYFLHAVSFSSPSCF